MILSFHPCYVGDENRLCAGRDPGPRDAEAINAADAVILPQGCRETLYRMAMDSGAHVFPNYDARFAYPGKTGQIRLFQMMGLPHPRSEIFPDAIDFMKQGGPHNPPVPFSFPMVIKRNWGGEGEGIFLADSPEVLRHWAQRMEDGGKSGQEAFLLQEFIPAGNRSLRVAVIGDTLLSYWRIQPDPEQFLANLAASGILDKKADQRLQEIGREAVGAFCKKTGINLAGIDLIFSTQNDRMEPLFLEINYFFGRTGLGGSQAYYALLKQAVDRWLTSLTLKKPG